MAKLTKQLMVYRLRERSAARTVTVDGPDLILDCLDRETSCLDLQMLSEAADSSPSCEVTFKVTISLRRQYDRYRLGRMNSRTAKHGTECSPEPDAHPGLPARYTLEQKLRTDGCNARNSP